MATFTSRAQRMVDRLVEAFTAAAGVDPATPGCRLVGGGMPPQAGHGVRGAPIAGAVDDPPFGARHWAGVDPTTPGVRTVGGGRPPHAGLARDRF